MGPLGEEGSQGTDLGQGLWRLPVPGGFPEALALKPSLPGMSLVSSPCLAQNLAGLSREQCTAFSRDRSAVLSQWAALKSSVNTLQWPFAPPSAGQVISALKTAEMN